MTNIKYSAIMIEPRKHLAYEFVLLNFLKNLSSEWQFHLFVGNDNELYVRTIVNKIPDNNRICIHNIGIKNLTYTEYNKLLIEPFIYSFIPTETFLIFQTDCIINPSYKHLINEFLDYDYVGAPWKSNGQVGNGGLSLRKKTKMLEIINNKKWNGSINEDYFFSYYPGMNKPTLNQAKTFSIETIFHEHSFGIHNCWRYLSNNQMVNITKICPLLTDLIRLQGCEK